MSDSEPQQTPTPEKTPKNKRPEPPLRTDSEYSTTTEMADNEDQGYESRSRSQSRRRRRQNQRQRQAQAQSGAENGNGAQAQSMASIEELQEPQQTRLKNPDPADTAEMQPFERIKPPSQSMDGPVTYARAMRGEIPMRGAPPTQALETTKGADAGGSGGGSMMDQDGLKLKIELNLEIEIELKASIHGDLTLALL